MRARANGFTLIEMMAVVAIFGFAASAAAVSMADTGRGQSSASLARGIQYALLEARPSAISDGHQRRLTCTASSCTLQIAPSSGMGTVTTWNAAGDRIYVGKRAYVWAIRSSTDVGTTNPGAGPISSTSNVIAYPDGTASASTVYVCDTNSQAKYKVYVYSATGMARLVGGW